MKGEYHSCYIGEQNTYLYFYGNSFDELKKSLKNIQKLRHCVRIV